MAAATQGSTRRQRMKPSLMYLAVATAVPMQLESLLVAMTVWMGRPAMRKVGVEMSPPPPAMASMKPASVRPAQAKATAQGSMSPLPVISARRSTTRYSCAPACCVRWALRASLRRRLTTFSTYSSMP